MTPAAVQLRLLPVSVLALRARSLLAASQLEIFVIELPMSGITDGSGTPTPAPPK